LLRNLRRPLELSIGTARLQISFSQEELYRRALIRYQGFETSDDPGFFIRLLDSHEVSAPSDFHYEWEGASLRCGDREAVFSGVRHEYALDSLLRVFLSWTLLPKPGFLLHAATIVRNGRAFVFAGRSGAGKSTLAALAPAGAVMTDEISLLCAEGGEWRAYSTPFWGEFRAAGKHRHAPLAGIFQLVQAPQNRAERISAAEAVRMLLPNVLFFSKEPEANRRLLQTVSAAVEGVACHRFEFRRDASLWEALPA